MSRRVTFVGLGLIGGSCAAATKRAWPDAERVGVDRPGIVEAGLDSGVIGQGFTPDQLDEAVADADLVVLALPVLAIVQLLEERGTLLRDRVVTDTGTNKRVIHDAARRAGLARFVGGHPMAGKPRGGLAHADPELLEGARWFLCPADTEDQDAIERVRGWVLDLRASPVDIDVDEHDRAVALTSHLPHLITNLLAETVLDTDATKAAGGSLREILRVAGAPFDIWWDNLSTNRPAVEAALDELAGRLSDLRASLDDRERVRGLFVHGREVRERLRGKG